MPDCFFISYTWNLHSDLVYTAFETIPFKVTDNLHIIELIFFSFFLKTAINKPVAWHSWSFFQIYHFVIMYCVIFCTPSVPSKNSFIPLSMQLQANLYLSLHLSEFQS